MNRFGAPRWAWVGIAPLANATPDAAKTVTCSASYNGCALAKPMFNALLTGERSEILKSHPNWFSDRTFSYTIERRGNQSWYSVTDGKNEISVPIDCRSDWAQPAEILCLPSWECVEQAA
jgi:hypothetical protein